MNERMNQSINELINKWINDWKNECMDGQIKEVIKWIDDCSLSNQIKNGNIYEFQLACYEERAPAGHAIRKNSVPDS